jgi:hypothetical protein
MWTWSGIGRGRKSKRNHVDTTQPLIAWILIFAENIDTYHKTMRGCDGDGCSTTTQTRLISAVAMRELRSVQICTWATT